MKVICRNSSNEAQTKNHCVTELLLLREPGARLSRKTTFRECSVVNGQVGDVAKPHLVQIGLGARTQSKIFAVRPVEQIMSTIIARFRIVRYLIPVIAGVVEDLLCRFIHFNLKSFIRGWSLA